MAEVQLDFLGDLRRTHICGELRAPDAGKHALLMGWVHRRRDLGGVIFIHLRDRDGVTQLVFDVSDDPESHGRGRGTELGICDRGRRRREAAQRRTQSTRPLPPAKSKWRSTKIWILNESRTPPFPLEDNVDVKEDARLKYRYVDLRRPHMQRNIIMRSKIAFAVRAGAVRAGLPRNRNAVHDALDAGRRARLSGAEPRAAGQFLCAAAIAADFQAAADGERLRASISRSCAASATKICAPTASPSSRRSISKCRSRSRNRSYEVIEPLMSARLRSGGKQQSRKPIPRITYDQAMRSYGSDKPDLRMPPFHCVEDLFPEPGLTPRRLAAGGDSHSQSRPAQPQGTRRVESVRTGARPARLSTT